MDFYIIVIYFIFILISVFLARKNNRSDFGWAVATLLFGPLALITLIVLISSSSTKKNNSADQKKSAHTKPASTVNSNVPPPTYLDGRLIPEDCLKSYKFSEGFHYVFKSTREHLFWNDSVEVTVTDDGEWFCVEWITTEFKPEAIFDSRQAWTNKCAARDKNYYLDQLVEYASNPLLNLGIYDPIVIKEYVEKARDNRGVDPQIPRKMEIELLDDIVTHVNGNTYRLTSGYYDTKVRSWNGETGAVNELELCGNEEGKMDQLKYNELQSQNKIKVLKIIEMY